MLKIGVDVLTKAVGLVEFLDDFAISSKRIVAQVKSKVSWILLPVNLWILKMHGKARIFQLNPTPLAISVAKKGIEAKPTNSTLIISLNLETKFSVT